jgi:hypothetical protein
MQGARRKGRKETDPTTRETNPGDASYDCRDHGEDLETGRIHRAKKDMYVVTHSSACVSKYCLEFMSVPSTQGGRHGSLSHFL